MSDTLTASEEKITVRLPNALLARVDSAARTRGVARSAFVREALAAQVDALLGPGPQPSEPTLYDLLCADGVIGRFEGPPGLSTTSRADLRERMRTRAVGAADVG